MEACEKKSMEEQVALACSQIGLIVPEAASWITPIIQALSTKGYAPIERAVRITGDPVDAATKKKLRVRANARLGTTYLSSLTEAGRKRPMDAAFLVVQRAIHGRAVKKHLEQWRNSFGVKVVKILAVKDGRTCEAAKSLEGITHSIDRVPPLPLLDCNADFCRCLYSADVSDFESRKGVRGKG